MAAADLGDAKREPKQCQGFLFACRSWSIVTSIGEPQISYLLYQRFASCLRMRS
jgi:hypothetical protein